MANPFDMYKTKVKRAVDPNAPPRPNLMSHEKVLKDTKGIIEQQAQDIAYLKQKITDLESKLRNQTSYLSALHQTISTIKSRLKI
jgi:CII-binding regulator of phage lambda lysogenization HflD